MAFTSTAAYTWVDGEVVTATKLNTFGLPTIANGQSYQFAAGSSGALSSAIGDSSTGFYQIASGQIGQLGTHTIDSGTGSYPALAPTPSTNNLRLFSADAALTRLFLTSFNNATSLNSLIVAGTRASPAAATDSMVMRYELDSWDGVAGASYNVATMDLRTDGLQTASNHGGYFVWSGVPNGSTSSTEWFRLQSGKAKITGNAQITGLTGGVVTADASGNLSTGGDARVTTNQSTTSTTFVSVTGLSLALAASTTYFVEVNIFGTATTTGQPTIQLAASGGLTVASMNMSIYSINGSFGGSAAINSVNYATALPILNSGNISSNGNTCHYRGTGVMTTGVAGNLIVQMEYVLGSGNTMTIYAGSVISARKIV